MEIYFLTPVTSPKTPKSCVTTCSSSMLGVRNIIASSAYRNRIDLPLSGVVWVILLQLLYRRVAAKDLQPGWKCVVIERHLVADPSYVLWLGLYSIIHCSESKLEQEQTRGTKTLKLWDFTATVSAIWGHTYVQRRGGRSWDGAKLAMRFGHSPTPVPRPRYN